MKNCLAPCKELLQRINARDDVPPVSCIVADGIMSFTLDAAEEIGVPEVIFWTTSACGFLSYLYFHNFIEKDLCPLKGIMILINDLIHVIILNLVSFLLLKNIEILNYY